LNYPVHEGYFKGRGYLTYPSGVSKVSRRSCLRLHMRPRARPALSRDIEASIMSIQAVPIDFRWQLDSPVIDSRLVFGFFTDINLDMVCPLWNVHGLDALY